MAAAAGDHYDEMGRRDEDVSVCQQRRSHGWRRPTIEELTSLVDKTQASALHFGGTGTVYGGKNTATFRRWCVQGGRSPDVR